jgi:CHAT domain-containing protein
MLLSPAAALLGAKRLLVVADGALQYVPFAALPIPKWPAGRNPNAIADYRPLIADHEIVSLPSASTLAVLRGETGARKPAPKTVAVLADPVFNSDDVRVKRRMKPRNDTDVTSVLSPQRRDLERSAMESGVSDTGLRLARLIGSRREAAAIRALVPEGQRKQALDFEANRTTVTGGELGNYRIVHFATHGLVNNVHPELSGLVLSLVNERGEPQDGFLRLNEIYNLKLPADTVVLSACQTGLGKEIKGEGLVGLTRGFMYAGAARVVTSLWKVDDQATSELMKYFYQGMLGPQKLSPAAALRAAQVAMWKQKGWESPYYWAAFVLQGEWK